MTYAVAIVSTHIRYSLGFFIAGSGGGEDFSVIGALPRADGLQPFGEANFRAEGATTLQPGATPREPDPNRPRPERAALAEFTVMRFPIGSIPHESLVIHDLVSLQKLAELVLKRNLLMVLLLILDVTDHGVGLRFAN